ncbi:MAG TPA: hypothetical protein PKC58_13705 [Ignavibacteria bacterium]|nr:hypothetical protein [Ignavibacteria bacterium]
MKYNDTKLIVFLKTFSMKELEEFEKFIISPYFKQGRDLLPLYKAIIKFHPEFDAEKFNEEIVFKEMYPDSDFGDRKSKDILKTLSSSLLKMAEEFLVISNLRKNKVLKNRTMLEELLDRGLVKYYIQYRTTAENELDKEGELSAQTYHEDYFIDGINTRYYVNILDHKNYLKYGVKSGEDISVYYILNLLRISKLKYFSHMGNNLKSEQDITSGMLEQLDMEKILNICKNKPYHFLIEFHYNSYLSLINKCDIGYFQKAKNIFFKNKSKLSRLEKFYLYADLLNILNIGYQFLKIFENRNQIYALLKSCIEDKAYKLSGEAFMQPGFYRNIILNAIYFKEFDFADKFIEEYSAELKPSQRKNMKFYSKALISFANSDFEGAMLNVSKVRYDLENFKIDVKILSLKIYYELQLTEQAFSMIDAFKHNLKSNKDIPEALNKSYFNFLNSYLKLYNMKNKGSYDDAEYLRNEIENEAFMAQKNWLVEKINALK